MDQYEYTPLLSERVLLCVPAEFPINEELQDYALLPQSIREGNVDLDQAPSLPIRCFAKEKFILLKSGHDMHHRAQRAFDAGKITPSVPFYVDQLNISYALAESGLGICFVTDTFVHYARPNENIRLYKIDEEPERRIMFVAHKKNRYCTHAMREFILTAQQILGQPNEHSNQ